MVHIIYNDQNQPIGWELKPITKEEQEIAATVRNLQFFGFNDTNVEYNGLELIEPSKGKTLGNIKSLSWIQKKYHK
jgi:hypothetical protein